MASSSSPGAWPGAAIAGLELWPAAAAREHGREDSSCSSGLHGKTPSKTNGSLRACCQCRRPLWAPGAHHWPAKHTQANVAQDCEFAHRQMVTDVEAHCTQPCKLLGESQTDGKKNFATQTDGKKLRNTVSMESPWLYTFPTQNNPIGWRQPQKLNLAWFGFRFWLGAYLTRKGNEGRWQLYRAASAKDNGERVLLGEISSSLDASGPSICIRQHDFSNYNDRKKLVA
jgi:hypothetical protein